MSMCLLARVFECKGQIIAEYLQHLVKAVNKLLEAVGDTKGEIRYQRNVDNEQDVMQSVIQTIGTIAKQLDAERLERVADMDAAKETEIELKECKEKLTQLERRNQELQAIIDEKSVAETSSETPSAEISSDYKGLAEGLIKFRDQLLYFKDKFAKDGDAKVVKFMASLYKETGRFMKENGVEPLEETGAFHPERHMVNSTQNTDDPALYNTIAETFRPGYRIGGEPYRPQEVILYVNRQ